MPYRALTAYQEQLFELEDLGYTFEENPDCYSMEAIEAIQNARKDWQDRPDAGETMNNGDRLARELPLVKRIIRKARERVDLRTPRSR